MVGPFCAGPLVAAAARALAAGAGCAAEEIGSAGACAEEAKRRQMLGQAEQSTPPLRLQQQRRLAVLGQAHAGCLPDGDWRPRQRSSLPLLLLFSRMSSPHERMDAQSMRAGSKGLDVGIQQVSIECIVLDISHLSLYF